MNQRFNAKTYEQAANFLFKNFEIKNQNFLQKFRQFETKFVHTQNVNKFENFSKTNLNEICSVLAI